MTRTISDTVTEISSLRHGIENAAWEEARGKLMAYLRLRGSCVGGDQEEYDALEALIKEFIERVDEGDIYQQETDELTRLRAENARLREAVGLMTTMAPFMELDVNDPVGTAKTVWAEQEKLFQENARLREALKPFVPKTQVIDAAIPDTRPIDVMVRAGELRAAAAAIREGENRDD